MLSDSTAVQTLLIRCREIPLPHPESMMKADRLSGHRKKQEEAVPGLFAFSRAPTYNLLYVEEADREDHDVFRVACEVRGDS